MLEHLAHNELSDENLLLLRDYCATIHRRYENNALFGRHLDAFIANYGFAPRTIANAIQQAFDQEILPPYKNPSEDNSARMTLIDCLITSIPARRKLLEMQRGYVVRTEEDPDELIYAGFSKETARSFIENFEKWYFGSHGGGHPWEVVPGGNSTHMDLFVRHDKHTLEWKVRLGNMTQEEADHHPVGFYYQITGKHRPMESVNFYLALHDAELPVLISDAKEILARFDASDYIGIVPHAVIPKYCENMFPKEYGRVIDFMHVYKEDLVKYKDDIIWLPEDPAELLSC